MLVAFHFLMGIETPIARPSTSQEQAARQQEPLDVFLPLFTAI